MNYSKRGAHPDMRNTGNRDSDRAALEKAHRMFRSQGRRMVKDGRNISVWMKESEANPENIERLKQKFCDNGLL